jgi:hypothetical protein
VCEYFASSSRSRTFQRPTSVLSRQEATRPTEQERYSSNIIVKPVVKYNSETLTWEDTDNRTNGKT